MQVVGGVRPPTAPNYALASGGRKAAVSARHVEPESSEEDEGHSEDEEDGENDSVESDENEQDTEDDDITVGYAHDTRTSAHTSQFEQFMAQVSASGGFSSSSPKRPRSRPDTPDNDSDAPVAKRTRSRHYQTLSPAHM